MGGHSGNPKISGRVFRVFKISGFQNCYPKFVLNNQNPTFRVPEMSGSGSVTRNYPISINWLPGDPNQEDFQNKKHQTQISNELGKL